MIKLNLPEKGVVYVVAYKITLIETNPYRKGGSVIHIDDKEIEVNEDPDTVNELIIQSYNKGLE